MNVLLVIDGRMQAPQALQFLLLSPLARYCSFAQREPLLEGRRIVGIGKYTVCRAQGGQDQ